MGVGEINDEGLARQFDGEAILTLKALDEFVGLAASIFPVAYGFNLYYEDMFVVRGAISGHWWWRWCVGCMAVAVAAIAVVAIGMVAVCMMTIGRGSQ